MDPIYIIAAVGLALAIGFVLARTLGARSAIPTPAEAEKKATFERQIASMLEVQNQLAGRLATMQEGQTASQQALNQSLNERLDKVSQRLTQSLTENTQKTNQTLNERLEKVSKNLTETSLKNREQLGAQLGTLNERLAIIGEAQKKLDSLTTEVVGLQEVLGNKQARGAFGEKQLEQLVTDALPPSSYSFQATLSNHKRVDCLIKLPNQMGSIPIDAKFPLDSYRALIAAKDEATKKEASRQFRIDMLKHIKDISTKYLIPGETTDSAFLFLPSEAVYAELHARFFDIVEKSYSARVWIVSPTTMMATLHTVRAVLKDAQIRKQAHVIQAEVGKLLEDVGRLDDRVNKLKGHFAQAEKDIRDIETSTSKIVRKGERIAEVELEDPAQLSSPSETTLQSGKQPDLLAGE